MPKPRVLIVSFSRIVSDARLLKQLDVLRDEFDLVTAGYGPTPAGVVDHLTLPDDRVYWRYSRAAVMLRQFRRAYWTNPAVSYLRERLAHERFDVVIANDIDTVPLALSLNPVGGVHADLHEYAPRQKEDLLRWRLFVAPFVRWMCRRFLPQVASITTVGGGIAREYERRFAVRADVVTNAAPYAELEPTSVHDPIRLVHSGACLPDRGIDEIVAAVAATRVEVTLDLYLVPNDPGYLQQLSDRVAAEPRIVLHPAVPYERLIATLNDYDVGVHLLPPVNFNNAWALPNKFFDFVQARLGVIVGPSPEMRTLVDEVGLGVVTGGFSTADLVAALDDLDAERVAQWKQRADASARDLSAGAQVEVWLRRIRALAGR